MKATRDAVTDIMRGVLAKVSQFSRSGEAAEGSERRASNGHSNGHSQSQSQSHGHSTHSSSSSRGPDLGPSPALRGSFDELVAQLKQEKTQLERRVRALEEEKESLSGNRAGAPPHSAEADSESALRARCDILTREREAVQTIMYVTSGDSVQRQILLRDIAHEVVLYQCVILTSAPQPSHLTLKLTFTRPPDQPPILPLLLPLPPSAAPQGAEDQGASAICGECAQCCAAVRTVCWGASGRRPGEGA